MQLREFSLSLCWFTVTVRDYSSTAVFDFSPSLDFIDHRYPTSPSVVLRITPLYFPSSHFRLVRCFLIFFFDEKDAHARVALIFRIC